MVIYDVDENAPWRNDPDAKEAALAIREWNVYNRKEVETIKPRQQAVIIYGRALLRLRKAHPNNKEFNNCLIAQRLNESPFDDFRERSAAMAIAKAVIGSADNASNSADNAFDDCGVATASHMAKWARKAGLIAVKKRNPALTQSARAQIRLAVENGKPVKRDDVSQTTGLSDGAVGRAQAMEQARLEGVTEGEAIALNAQGKLTKAQARHVEALIKKFRRDLDLQFAAAVEAEVSKRVEERKAALDSAREACNKQRNDAFKKQQHWQQLINNRKLLFTMEEFTDIVFCTHWDQRKALSEERANRAFIAINAKKLQLTGKA